MKVILQDTIEKGKVGDVIEVKRGYARNFLFPKGLAVPVTEENKKILEEKRAELDAIAEKELAHAKDTANSMKGLALSLSAEAHENGDLFGAVSMNQVQDLIAKNGFNVEKKVLHIAEGSINHVGDYTVILQLHPSVKHLVPLKVVANKAEA